MVTRCIGNLATFVCGMEFKGLSSDGGQADLAQGGPIIVGFEEESWVGQTHTCNHLNEIFERSNHLGARRNIQFNKYLRDRESLIQNIWEQQIFVSKYLSVAIILVQGEIFVSKYLRA